MEKQMKFLNLFHKMHALIECKGNKRQFNKFNEYINSLPQDKANTMKAIKQYRNELAFSSQNNPLPCERAKLDEWIAILEEEIKVLENKQN